MNTFAAALAGARADSALTPAARRHADRLTLELPSTFDPALIAAYAAEVDAEKTAYRRRSTDPS